jgi:hypothetical protein
MPTGDPPIMSIPNTAGTSQCPYCHQWFMGGHYCPASQGQGSGTWTPSPMTADEFRKILREELEWHRSEMAKDQR